MIGLLLLAGGLAASSAALLSDQELLTGARDAYRAGLAARADADVARREFARAAELFEQLRDGHSVGSGLYRNLAQSYLLAGDLGRAIATYRHGLMQYPSDRTLRDGLAAARAQVAYPLDRSLAGLAEPRESWSLLQLAPLPVFEAVGMSFYVAACLAFARGWMKRRAAWWIVGALLLVSAGWLLVNAVVEPQRRVSELSNHHWAVTITADTPFRTGNSSEYPPRLEQPLPAGVELRRLAERGGWTQVQLAGGPVGWVPGDHIIVIGR